MSIVDVLMPSYVMLLCVLHKAIGVCYTQMLAKLSLPGLALRSLVKLASP